MNLRGLPLARAGGLRRARRFALALTAVAASGALVACSESNASDSGSGDDSSDSSESSESSSETSPVTLTPSVEPGKRNVSVDTQVAVEAADGTIDKVVLKYRGADGNGKVPGTLSDDGTAWTADDRLEPGARYRLVMRGQNADGEPTTERSRFRTEDLTLDEQTYMEYVQPYDDSTVGVGMPVVIQFDIPVTNKASIERNLHVTSTPQVEGAWHWYSDTEVHYRPKNYWPTGTKVQVDADINGVAAGNGIYGQESQKLDFTIGRKVISKINLDKHEMKVFVNDRLAKTFPVTGGMPGYETRSGTKVVMEKYEIKHMDAATTGVSENDPEYYDIPDVPNALRVTWSGEFLHGAPWSEGSQGFDNVSHGCVGMSVENSEWMYDHTLIGDVVKTTGTERGIEPGNGWTDWDMPWSEFTKGSALR